MEVRVVRFVLLVILLLLLGGLELADFSPVKMKSVPEELILYPDDIHDEQSEDEKKMVYLALQKLEREVSQQKSIKDVSKTTNYLFQGDIALRPKEAQSIVESAARRQKRKMTSKEKKRWDFPIPYRFDITGEQNHVPEEKNHIRAAIGHWESLTCISFKEVDNNYTEEQPILLFKRDIGCWSFVGREHGFTNQEVSIGEGCFNIGTIVHEIGHAIGFWHEQSRPDRDDHVIVRGENVKYGKNHNFVMESWEDVVDIGVPYDVGSIMHYKATEYSYSGKSLTIQTRDPLLQRVPGQRMGLSFYDVKLANLAYCNKKCGQSLLIDNLTCLHDGYTDPLNCNRCRCPDGLHGSRCQTVQSSYGQPCGGVLHIEGSETYKIQTPGYPYNFSPGQRCNWLIKAKKGKSVYLDVSNQNFILTPNCDNSTLTACTGDYMEVKYHITFGVTGARFCCSLAPVQTIVSKGSEMLVMFRSRQGGLGGFQATVSSESCGGCASSTLSDQIACVRQIAQSCPQTWVIRVKEECPVYFLPPGVDCGGYVNKTVTRNATCQIEEKYCCSDRKLVNGRCVVSAEPVLITSTSITSSFNISMNDNNDPAIGNDVNIGWSEWVVMSACSQMCGGCGKQTLRRTCEYPASCGGKSEEEKTISCNSQKCNESLVSFCNQVRKVEYRCGLFWPMETCFRYESFLTVCKSYCCQGYKESNNGTCIASTS